MMQPCLCQSGEPYQQCCEPLHLGQPAPNATRLMRSRYSAYVMQLDDYLRQSWHTSTRPDDLTKADLQGIDWVGLEIVAAETMSASEARITFKARFKIANQETQTLHETSRFVLESKDQPAHWFYVDGIIHQNN